MRRQPSAQAKGCGFPVAHLLALFHSGTGFLRQVLASPVNTHDMKHATVLHPGMAEGDVLIADRGLASFAHLALLLGRGMHAVFRCHQKQIVSFRVGRKHTKQHKPHKPHKGRPRSRYVRRLGRRDQLVEYSKPKNKPSTTTKLRIMLAIAGIALGVAGTSRRPLRLPRSAAS